MMINVCCTVNPKVTFYQIRFDRLEVTETIEVDASKDTTRTASLHPLTSMVSGCWYEQVGYCIVELRRLRFHRFKVPEYQLLLSIPFVDLVEGVLPPTDSEHREGASYTGYIYELHRISNHCEMRGRIKTADVTSKTNKK